MNTGMLCYLGNWRNRCPNHTWCRRTSGGDLGCSRVLDGCITWSTNQNHTYFCSEDLFQNPDVNFWNFLGHPCVLIWYSECNYKPTSGELLCLCCIPHSYKAQIINKKWKFSLWIGEVVYCVKKNMHTQTKVPVIHFWSSLSNKINFCINGVNICIYWPPVICQIK